MRWRSLGALFAAAAVLAEPNTSLSFLNQGRPILDAHNCYPYEGKWADRIDRALGAGFPVSIEQDLTWHIDPASRQGRIAISHGKETSGSEPGLRNYFFERVRPIVERALAQNRRSEWPPIILHFDFKSEEPPLLHAVWDLLGEYQDWITTAPKTSDARQPSPLEARPILVITEDSDRQEEVFYNQLPVGAKLRIFGSAQTRGIRADTREERLHLAATTPPETMLPTAASNYRRWWNNSWAEVEEGGQRRTGEWTAAGATRLRALVDRAHHLGYWIRFYTLDGFTADEDRGWDEGYNFGSHPAAAARWKAAIAAGVDFIATDQYEDLARLLDTHP